MDSSPQSMDSSQTSGGPVDSLRRVIGASVIGTSLEWYDFFLYGSAAALVFNKLFFPKFDPLVGTLLAFATYSVGFFARPVGAAFFGHLGDRVGRKTVLVATLLTMGVASTLIGILPTYATIGTLAPVALVALRFVQGFGLGGEWGGAVVLALEHGAAGKRGLYASWPQVGVPAGNLLAALVLGVMSAVLDQQAFLSWGWRIPFLLSAGVIAIGLAIRLRIAESPLFRAVDEDGTKAQSPITDVLRRYPRQLITAVCARVGVDVVFYVFVLFVLTYVTSKLHLPRQVGLNAVLVGSAVQLVAIPCFGAACDRYGRRPVYLAGVVGAAVWVFCFFALLDTRSSLLIIVATVVALLLHAVMYAPQAAFTAELFGTSVRYSGASLGYQIAGVLGGSLAPLIAVALLAAYSSWVPIAIYVVAMLGVTVVGLAMAPETSEAELDVSEKPSQAPELSAEPAS
jgi:metabolite-proton symporter